MSYDFIKIKRIKFNCKYCRDLNESTYIIPVVAFAMTWTIFVGGVIQRKWPSGIIDLRYYTLLFISLWALMYVYSIFRMLTLLE